MFGLAVWVLLSLVGGFLTLWAVWARGITKWRLVSLLGYLAWIIITGAGLLATQGWATQCSLLLPGKYDIIGYLPEPETKIYLFLGTSFGPKICYIPWDAQKADQLLKDQEEGSEFSIQWMGEGEGTGIPGFDNGGEISTRPPADTHKPKPEEKVL